MGVSGAVRNGRQRAGVMEALQLVLSKCKPKAKIVDICEKGDSFIREQAGNTYKNVKKKIERVLEEGDMLKIDMGCHIDGFIAVVAHTHVLQEGPVTGRAADVVAAANIAAEVALRLVRPGRTNSKLCRSRRI
ncbi:hypothetical protein F0562_017719 [Nyssa sinensis]|uniref:Peptidase M24 domain-containing protein n=1 Tax=Nyssa sinensis TaxID=561372 RepID=A0A5J4ZIK5_9ASTE|nr:hypothetical protein F0562_017719 [Nyssa sinensis]